MMSFVSLEVDMRSVVVALLLSAVCVAFIAPPANSVPPDAPAAIQISPGDVVWKDGPPSLPPGTQAAILEGSPGKEGIVTMRLRVPKGWRLPSHTHRGDERVTVLEGVIRVALEDGPTRSFPAGSFYVTPKGVKHVVSTGDEGAVIQITVQGPWVVDYVDPRDDPRGEAKKK